jgi:nitroreductase
VPKPQTRQSIVKKLKRVGRELLFDCCRALDAASRWIQYRILHQTLEQKRSQDNFTVPLESMDRDLLAMYIRWVGHTVEKTVRYRKSAGRGHGNPILLRAAVDEWHRRGYPPRQFVVWAESNLEDYERWNLTGEPQIHSAAELPTIDETTPVLKVLTNRVSTRFWKPVPVEEVNIQQILLAGTHAPTSCNRQTWKLYVRCNRQIEETADLPGVGNRTLLERAPVVIFITIDERLYPEVWAAAQDAGIIGLQLNLAATALGLAGCLMYGGDNFPQEEWHKQYNVPNYRYMHLSFLFGYPAERTQSDKRAHPDDIAIFV